MISEKNTLIGHIVESNGAEFVAQLLSDDDGFVPEVTMDGQNVRIGQIGSYLMVRQSGIYVLAIVESMWQEIDAAGKLVRMLRINPLGEITAKGGFARGVAHFPTTGAELHLVTAATLSVLFSKYSAANFKVGKLSAFDTVDVYIDPNTFFGRHAAILGQSGSGKSWTVTSFIQSTLQAMPNAHVIILDLHGAQPGCRPAVVRPTPGRAWPGTHRFDDEQRLGSLSLFDDELTLPLLNRCQAACDRLEDVVAKPCHVGQGPEAVVDQVLIKSSKAGAESERQPEADCRPFGD